MLGEVTQDNLHLFIPGKVAGVAVLMAEERGISPEEALVEFYRTRTYRLLENEKSKYWHYSPEQLYQTMKEQNIGRGDSKFGEVTTRRASGSLAPTNG